MHVMQRKRGEQFLVGDDISIVVLEIDRRGVKFGICSETKKGTGAYIGEIGRFA